MPETDRLLLDIPCQGDFTKYFEIHSDPQTNLFNPKGPLNLENAGIAFARFLNHWNEHGFGSWIVRLKNTGAIIGFGGLSMRLYGDEWKLNLGYRFDKNYWGQGYATELAKYTILYAFSELKADKIFAIVRPKHSVSVRVLEKCGMKLYGTLNDVPGEAESLVYIIETC